MRKTKNIFRQSAGNITYSNFELRFFRKGELDSIFLTQIEFELLVDNLLGQKQLIKRHGGDKVEELIATFRNDSGTTFNICFNSKRIKAYNFVVDQDLDTILRTDYKKAYASFLNL